MDELSLEQRLMAWLVRRSAGSSSSRMQAKGVLRTAAKALSLELLEAREAIRLLRMQGLVDYEPDPAGLPFTGYLRVKPPVLTLDEAMRRWTSALQPIELQAELRSLLETAYDIFTELDDQDLATVAAGFGRLAAAQRVGGSDHRYGFGLSAREFLGSSKMLDRLPARVRRVLGIDSLPSTPRYVVVAAPAQPSCVVLVENTTAFEEAACLLPNDVALVAAYGYGLNIMTDSVAGWALVESLSGAGCKVLSRRGSNHDLDALLGHSRLFFWGDLDREGLRIAMALRRRLPQLALSALYEPMCRLVESRETSHPYVAIAGKSGQAPWVTTDDPVMNRLASLCQGRAVDQEAIDLHDQAAVARRGFG